MVFWEVFFGLDQVRVFGFWNHLSRYRSRWISVSRSTTYISRVIVGVTNLICQLISSGVCLEYQRG